MNKTVPEARPVTFGHLGDGNLHFNFGVPDTSRRAEGARIVHDIVHAHGGEIWVESKLGEGSIFRFTLPVAEKT